MVHVLSQEVVSTRENANKQMALLKTGLKKKEIEGEVLHVQHQELTERIALLEKVRANGISQQSLSNVTHRITKHSGMRSISVGLGQNLDLINLTSPVPLRMFALFALTLCAILMRYLQVSSGSSPAILSTLALLSTYTWLSVNFVDLDWLRSFFSLRMPFSPSCFR